MNKLKNIEIIETDNQIIIFDKETMLNYSWVKGSKTINSYNTQMKPTTCNTFGHEKPIGSITKSHAMKQLSKIIRENRNFESRT